MCWFTKKSDPTPALPEAPFDMEVLKGKARDHICLMLGFPVINMELDKLQLAHAVEYAQELICYAKLQKQADYSVLLKEGGLAFAKYMLARIRINTGKDDGNMLSEALRDIDAFRIKLKID
jgi:hypothetical protein